MILLRSSCAQEVMQQLNLCVSDILHFGAAHTILKKALRPTVRPLLDVRLENRRRTHLNKSVGRGRGGSSYVGRGPGLGLGGLQVKQWSHGHPDRQTDTTESITW